MQISKHLRPRDCPVCGCRDASHVAYPLRIDEQALGDFAFASRKLPEFMHLQMLRCPTCGVLYASPSLSQEFLASAYKEASYDSDEEADYAARTYAGLLEGLLPLLGERGTALEVGAGNGAFLRHLLRAGFKSVVGIEPSREAVESAEECLREKILVRMFRASEFEPGSVDLFCCFQTIEHVEDPNGLCLDAHRLMRRDGAIFLVAHDHESWLTRIAGEKSPIFDIEHLQLFSRGSLGYLLRSCGFQDVVIGSVVNRYPLAYWIKLLPLPAKLKRRAVPMSKSLLFGRLPVCANVGNIYAIGFKRT